MCHAGKKTIAQKNTLVNTRSYQDDATAAAAAASYVQDNYYGQKCYQ